MLRSYAAIFLCLLLLTGCATPPRLATEGLWADADFAYRADRVSESREQLLELDPTLAAELAATKLRATDSDARTEQLIALLFPNGRSAFAYAA